MTDLPVELIEEILSPLPVITLKRFRCVAKYWCLLIDSERFVQLHRRFSLDRYLILRDGWPLGDVLSIDLDNPDKAHVLQLPFQGKSSKVISNSCNGLVLVETKPLTLWNPLTTWYKVLPEIGMDQCFNDPNPYLQEIFGFAYDSIKDDYKIVRVFEIATDSTGWMTSRFDMYSLKSNSWRAIEIFPYPGPFVRKDWFVYVNGALHVLKRGKMDKIVAFSVETEKHYEFEIPSRLYAGMVLKLDTLGGCLSLCTRKSKSMSIWVMNNYGVSESWMKLLTISLPEIEPFIDSHPLLYNLKPLAYSKDRQKVLLSCKYRLLWYDLRKKSMEVFDVEGLPFTFCAQVLTCKIGYHLARQSF